jgi:hypothetical protein
LRPADDKLLFVLEGHGRESALEEASRKAKHRIDVAELNASRSDRDRGALAVTILWSGHLSFLLNLANFLDRRGVVRLRLSGHRENRYTKPPRLQKLRNNPYPAERKSIQAD